MFLGQLGLDARINENFITGLGLTSTNSTYNYTSTDIQDIEFLTTSVGLQPYFGYLSSESGLELDATFRMSNGEIKAELPNFAIEGINTSQYSLSMNGSYPLYSNSNFKENAGTEINIMGRSIFAQQIVHNNDVFTDELQLDYHKIQFAVEALHQFENLGESSLTPKVTVGLVSENNDDNSFTGMNLVNEINYSHPFGLKLTGIGSIFFDSLRGINQWHLNGIANIDFKNDYRGLYAKISPSLGQINSENFLNTCKFDSFSVCDTIGGTSLNLASNSKSVISEFGYKYALSEASNIIPYAKVDFTDGDRTLFDIGSQLSLGSNINFEIVGTQGLNLENDVERNLKVNGRVRW